MVESSDIRTRHPITRPMARTKLRHMMVRQPLRQGGVVSASAAVAELHITMMKAKPHSEKEPTHSQNSTCVLSPLSLKHGPRPGQSGTSNGGDGGGESDEPPWRD